MDWKFFSQYAPVLKVGVTSTITLLLENFFHFLPKKSKCDLCLCLVSVDGSSDEIDVAMTKILTDNQFVQLHNVGTMNSMNWCRIMVQVTTHVIYFYFQSH